MLRTLLIFAILVPGICLALGNRFIALLLYLWFALFRPQEWIWYDVSSLRLSLVLGLILVVPSLLTGVYPYLGHPVSIGGIVFLFSALVGQFNAYSPATGWYWLDFFFRLLLVCLLTTAIVTDSNRFRWALAVVAGSLGFHSAKAGLMSLVGGGVRFFDGLAGAYVDNNGYAVAMAMIAPLLFAVSQNLDKRWLRWGFLAAAPLTAFAVISTFSRGGFLALAAAGVMVALLHQRKTRALLVALVIAIPLGMFMVSQEGYVDRLQTIRTYEETNEASAMSRLHFWSVAVAIASDNPLGIGLFNFEAAYDHYDTSDGAYGSRRSVHSSHFQALAETGVIGFLTFEGLLVYAFWSARRIRRRASTPNLDAADARLFMTAANGLIAAFAAFVVGGAFVAMALNDLTWILLALLASLDLISKRACQHAADAAQPIATVPTGYASTWQPRPRAAG